MMTVMTAAALSAKETNGSSVDAVVTSGASAAKRLLQDVSARLRQAAAHEIGTDRELMLAKATELRAIASDLEDLARLLDAKGGAKDCMQADQAVDVAVPAKPFVIGSSMHAPRSLDEASSQAVKMPRLVPVVAETVASEDCDFSARVAIPPGGLTFIASAAVVEDSDSDEDAGAAASVDIAEMAEAMRTTALEAGESTPMPKASHADGAEADATHPETDTELVGGFAHPTASFAQAVMAQAAAAASDAENLRQKGAGQAEESTAPAMPVPGDYEAAVLAAMARGETPLLPPSGFDVYGAPPSAGIGGWPSASVATAAAAADGSAMPGLPGMYGGMPLPYPLPHHLAMQCGYLPPHMYGVPPMGVVPSTAPPGLGSSPLHDGSLPALSSAAAPAESLPATPQQPQQRPEMWMPEHGASSSDSSAAVSSKAIYPAISLDASSAPMVAMMMAMPSSDHYQHAVAAAAVAAAAGYPMNVPFMYPHIDSSNISAAATGGGSDHNESVVSLDSLSNRGAVSHSASAHYSQQPQQIQAADETPRGFAQPPGAGAGVEYMWAEHQKHMLQGAYSYAQQQQAQGYHHGGQQGYRRRGSGSNISSGSGSGSNANNNSNNNGGGGSNSSHGGSSHGGSSGGYQQQQQQQQQPRDRRGNAGGYQRQQRWNNNSSSNNSGFSGNHHYSRHHHHQQQQQHYHHQQQHHRNHQSPHGHSSGSAGQDVGGVGFGATVTTAASEVSIGSNNSGYYSGSYSRQQPQQPPQ